MRVGAIAGRHRDAVAQKEPLVTAAVAEQLDVGCGLRIPLDEAADRRAQTRSETAGREQGDFLGTHK
jgi:hypothetical protein